MYRVTLTEEQRLELNQRAHQPGLAPRLRDRLEMLRLSDAGWSIPQIARHLGQDEQRTRFWIKAYLLGGFETLTNKARGGSVSALTPQIIAEATEQLRSGQRTWNAAQIADWIAQRYGLRRSPGQIRRKLRPSGLRYKRTSRSLRYKQKPEEVAQARTTLLGIKKGAMPVS